MKEMNREYLRERNRNLLLAVLDLPSVDDAENPSAQMKARCDIAAALRCIDSLRATAIMEPIAEDSAPMKKKQETCQKMYWAYEKALEEQFDFVSGKRILASVICAIEMEQGDVLSWLRNFDLAALRENDIFRVDITPYLKFLRGEISRAEFDTVLKEAIQ